SFGWHVIDVADGNDIEQLNAAFNEAKTVKGKPTMVIANTVKGKGSEVMENKANWHHKVPTSEELTQIYKDFATRKEAL
ncbi:transketolase, partial [Lachnospiraceae bacterium OttesenSCG-928-J05]|nr:transketolase [Lachnospiraceae bacterium OttesenSCG-928-J05]